MKKEKIFMKAYLYTYINIALRKNMKLNRRYLNKNIPIEDTIYKAQQTPHT